MADVEGQQGENLPSSPSSKSTGLRLSTPISSRSSTPKRRSTCKKGNASSKNKDRRAKDSRASVGKESPRLAVGIQESKKGSVWNLWTDDTDETFADETWQSKLWRLVVSLAGVPSPLNRSDFENHAKKYNQDASKMMDGLGTRINHTDVIHRDEFVFDFYVLIKESRLLFIYGVIILYFLVLSIMFGGIMKATGCVDVNGATMLGMGFIILSGTANLDYALSDATCVYLDSVAVLIGLYISLPVLCAIVMIRLLHNKHRHLRMSQHMLLNKRKGVPTLCFRLLNQSGSICSNLRVVVEVWINCGADEETGEKFFDLIPVEFAHPYTIGGTPFTCVHTVDDSSALKQRGVIVIDEETGAPRMSKDLNIVWSVHVIADTEMGQRSTILDSIFGWDDSFIVEANSSGDLPFFTSASIFMVSDWLGSKGKNSPTTDASKLSLWEYNTAYREKHSAYVDAMV